MKCASCEVGELRMATVSVRQAGRATNTTPFFIGVGDSLLLAGFSPGSRDVFYRWVRESPDFPTLQRLGRRTVVQRAAFLEWLARRPPHRLNGVGACSRSTKGPAAASAAEGDGMSPPTCYPTIPEASNAPHVAESLQAVSDTREAVKERGHG